MFKVQSNLLKLNKSVYRQSKNLIAVLNSMPAFTNNFQIVQQNADLLKQANRSFSTTDMSLMSSNAKKYKNRM